MGKDSKISWTDHTFNPWWGCVKVSPACDHCYAESFSKRVGEDVWGIDAPRRFFGDKHWNEPLKWNADAVKLGRQARVFCASMADVFEVNPLLDEARQRLWTLIAATPNLRWNLLTKRHLEIAKHRGMLSLLSLLSNVHPGVTVESQTYDFRIVEDVEWLSVEPMLGPLDLLNIPCVDDYKRDVLRGIRHSAVHASNYAFPSINWVIIGGESGAGAREMKLEWAINLIEQCKAAKVAVHFKQTGDVLARTLGLKDKSGKDPNEWPAELRIQDFPRDLPLE